MGGFRIETSESYDINDMFAMIYFKKLYSKTNINRCNNCTGKVRLKARVFVEYIHGGGGTQSTWLPPPYIGSTRALTTGTRHELRKLQWLQCNEMAYDSESLH